MGKEEDGESSRLQTEPKNPQNIFTLLKSLTVQYTWLWFSYTHARAQNTHTHANTPMSHTGRHPTPSHIQTHALTQTGVMKTVSSKRNLQ